MDIDLLRTFLEVRRLGNFRSAAENLHVTQAAVSQRIKNLESMLNAPLFIREKNNNYLTPAGEQLVPSAESIVATWNQARQAIGHTPQIGPSLSIAAMSGVWDLHGISSLRQIRSVWPQVRLRADVLSEDVIVKRLIMQILDLSFLLTACELDYIECESIAAFELALHSTHAKTLKQALIGPNVYVDWGRDVGAIFGGELVFEDAPQLQTSDHLLARRYLEANSGSAFLPINASAAKSRLKPVPDSPRIKRELFVAWNKKNPQQDLIGKIVSALRAESVLALAALN